MLEKPRGLPSFDSVLYPSPKHLSRVALFDRARDMVEVVDDIDLVDHVDWPLFVDDYGLDIEPDPGPPGAEPGGELPS